MKSVNDLTISGTIVSDVTPKPGQASVRFRLVHNFGGGRKPLYLDCFLVLGVGVNVPKKGAAIRVRAYLRMRGESFEAVVKSIDIEN